MPIRIGAGAVADRREEAMNVIGIDIGIHGGIALLPDGDAPPVVVDMPISLRVINRRKKSRIEAERLAQTLSALCKGFVVAYVERAQPSPRMGVGSSFAYGEAFGLVLGVLAQIGVRVRFASPAVWKKDMGLSKPGSRELGRDEQREKGSSLELARKLYPKLCPELQLEKHDGRAEALLIAHWGAEQLEAEAAGPLFGHSVASARKRATAEVEF